MLGWRIRPVHIHPSMLLCILAELDRLVLVKQSQIKISCLTTTEINHPNFEIFDDFKICDIL
jgi:hypothetical protein